MLTVSLLQHPSDKTVLLEKFNAQTATWVVSDLRNKFEVQKMILEKQSFFEDVSVLRANELWRFLLKRSHPDMKLISSEFVATWVKEQIKKKAQEEEGLRFGSNADQVVMEMMDLMASVHSNEEGSQKIREWFHENPESLQRWGGWFLFSEQFFQSLLQQKFLSPKWCAAFLQSELSWSSFWSRPLVFDLGSQLSQVEADLIRSLSRDVDVHVLAPSPIWKKEFEYLLKPYEFLTSQASQIHQVEAAAPMESFSKALRFSGILSETKKACEMVRGWLDEKTPPERIALIAPDIERYWPLLQPLLESEGILYSKDVFSRLQSLPAVSQWLAELRLSSRQVQYSDLEGAFFRGENPKLRFEEFYSLFAELISEEDLKRHEVVQKSFQAQYGAHDEISRDEWLGFSVRCWKDTSDFAPIELCFREILANADPSLKMQVSSWIHLLEQIVAKKEIRLQKGVNSGIHLTNLAAGDSILVSHRIFLGLTESMVRSQSSQLLSPKEVLNISNELGFSLEHPEVSAWEFDLAWLSENPLTQSLYFYPQTGFSGGAEAPCALWLRKADEESKDLSFPQKNRWDYVLHSEKLNWDPNETQIVHLKKPISLSPSSIEAYRKCPFTFASQKIFRLQDLPVMDFDIDRRTRGLLAHSLLEKLCVEPRRFDWTDEELRELVETLKSELGLASMDQFIWKGLMERHIQMARRFLRFEKEWLKIHPETKVFAREKEFEFFWDFEKQTVSSKGEWKIRGRIDRLDQDLQGRMVLIDYKMTLGDYKNHSKWIEKNQLQLALYILALEEGAIQNWEASEVVGAFYYVLKNMNRDRGLKVEEAAGTLFGLDRKGNRIKLEKKKELLESVKKVIHEVVSQIQSGHFTPGPLEPEKCGECHWKNLCRAPHLN